MIYVLTFRIETVVVLYGSQPSVGIRNASTHTLSVRLCLHGMVLILSTRKLYMSEYYQFQTRPVLTSWLHFKNHKTYFVGQCKRTFMVLELAQDEFCERMSAITWYGCSYCVNEKVCEESWNKNSKQREVLARIMSACKLFSKQKPHNMAVQAHGWGGGIAPTHLQLRR
jgi:hypothetical protein